ncbi:hypothetical protein D3C72_865830 [compost metagenome]
MGSAKLDPVGVLLKYPPIGSLSLRERAGGEGLFSDSTQALRQTLANQGCCSRGSPAGR